MPDLFGTLFDLQRRYFECMRQSLGEESAHPRQGPILGLLLAMDGVSQADLVRSLGVSAATVAVSVARLERLGYVRRERNQHNQRANVLALTEAGQAQARLLQSAMEETCRLALQGFSPEELASLQDAVARMAENLRHPPMGEGTPESVRHARGLDAPGPNRS